MSDFKQPFLGFSKLKVSGVYLPFIALIIIIAMTSGELGFSSVVYS